MDVTSWSPSPNSIVTTTSNSKFEKINTALSTIEVLLKQLSKSYEYDREGLVKLLYRKLIYHPLLTSDDDRELLINSLNKVPTPYCCNKVFPELDRVRLTGENANVYFDCVDHFKVLKRKTSETLTSIYPKEASPSTLLDELVELIFHSYLDNTKSEYEKWTEHKNFAFTSKQFARIALSSSNLKNFLKMPFFSSGTQGVRFLKTYFSDIKNLNLDFTVLSDDYTEQDCNYLTTRSFSRFKMTSEKFATSSNIHHLAYSSPELKDLHLGSCQALDDHGLLSIASSCPDLESLSLYEVKKISDFSLMTLSIFCSKLKSLKLSFEADESIKKYQQISDLGLSTLTMRCQQLEEIALFGNNINISDLSIEFLSNHFKNRLKNITLSIEGHVTVAAFYTLLKDCPDIKEFFFNSLDFAVCDSTLEEIAKSWHALEKLSIPDASKLSSDLNLFISNFSCLQEMEFSQLSLNAKGLQNLLKNRKQLRSLSFNDECKFCNMNMSDVVNLFIKCKKDLGNLKVLNFRNPYSFEPFPCLFNESEQSKLKDAFPSILFYF